MLTCFRFVLLTGGAIQAVLLFLRFLFSAGAGGRKAPAESEGFRDGERRRGKGLVFQTVRYACDAAVFLAAVQSELFPAWFGLFPESVMGFLTGFSLLITFSLALSVPVDWMLDRAERSGPAAPGEGIRFLNRELISILLVEAGIALALLSYWSMERLNAGIPAAAAVSVLSLAGFRAGCLALRNRGRSRSEPSGSGAAPGRTGKEAREPTPHGAGKRGRRAAVRGAQLAAGIACLAALLTRIDGISRRGGVFREDLISLLPPLLGILAAGAIPWAFRIVETRFICYDRKKQTQNLRTGRDQNDGL